MLLKEWLIAAFYTAGTAMLPILEVKAAIPIGTAMGLSLWESFAIATIASTIPAPLIVFFIRPLIHFLKGTRLFSRFGHFLERRAQKKGAAVRKYSLFGLFILVALPLPGTGVWTGSLVAALLDLRIRHALPVIFVGNITASVCVLALTGALIG